MLSQFGEFTASDKLDVSYDVCIAGAGVAGITLALELAKTGKQVLLLEAGDIDYSDQSQEVYAGDIVGREYFELDVARLRYLGGTSNHWAGYCRPLDDFDFEARPELDLSGWPIGKPDISPWLEPAAAILEIDPNYADDAIVDGTDGNLRRIDVRLSPPVRFGERYLEALKTNDNIQLVLNANLVDIKVDTASGAIQHMTIAGYGSVSQRFDVSADVFVLALGGIENARALLNANSQVDAGIGNGNDLVGRYFMEHVHLDGGFAILNGPLEEHFDGLKTFNRVGEAVNFAITGDFTRSSQILNCEMRLADIARGESKPDPESWKARIKRMLCNSDYVVDIASYFDEGFKAQRCMLAHEHANALAGEYDGVVRLSSEQKPNPNSRVLLSDERDKFGLRRTALDWQLTELDKKTIQESMLELGRYFASKDIGRLKVPDWMLDDGPGIAGMAEGERGADFHHLGTTRMAESASEGVVDSNCKIFGSTNFYVAGSSIFASGGHVPPTLTIVQLTLRLADHLNQRIG